MNDHLRARNDLLRAANRALIQAIAFGSNNGPNNPTDRMSLEKLRLENALLRSERHTLASFVTRLNLCRSLYPSNAATSTWLFAAAVMMELSLREVITLARYETRMWISSDKLNLSGYYSSFFPWYARNAPGFVHEASRSSSDLVPVDASALVTALMDIVSVTNQTIHDNKLYPFIIYNTKCFFFNYYHVCLGIGTLAKNLPIDCRSRVCGITAPEIPNGTNTLKFFWFFIFR